MNRFFIVSLVAALPLVGACKSRPAVETHASQDPVQASRPAVAAQPRAKMVEPSAAPESEVPADPAAIGDNRLLAIRFHSSDNEASAAVAPRFESMKELFGDKLVLFETFDLSTEQSRQQARARASTLGISKIFQQSAPAAGYVLLIDARTKKIAARLEPGQNPADWTARFTFLTEPKG